MKTYKIPVQWTVYDTVDIEANSLEDAVLTVLNNKDEISLTMDTAEYIDGSYEIDGESNADCYCYASKEHVHAICDFIRHFYKNIKEE